MPHQRVSDPILFDDLCKLTIPAVGSIVLNHLMEKVRPGVNLPDAAEVDGCIRDCGRALASAWTKAMRHTLARHTVPGPVLLNRNLLPATETIDHKIYHAMLDSVSIWGLTEADVHCALTLIGMFMFEQEPINFFLPFRMVLHQTASGYALSQRHI